MSKEYQPKSLQYFDDVVIAYDRDFVDQAFALRAMLECMMFRVHCYNLIRKSHAIDILGGQGVHSKYFVLLCHGGEDETVVVDSPEDMVLFLKVAEEICGRPNEWQDSELKLTPPNIPFLVKLEGCTLISVACGSGRESLTKAFLQAGCSTYIAPIEPPDDTLALQFVNAFFYYLLVWQRDPMLRCTEAEAVKRAAELDIDYQEGTRLFRHYAR